MAGGHVWLHRVLTGLVYNASFPRLLPFRVRTKLESCERQYQKAVLAALGLGFSSHIFQNSQCAMVR